MISLLREVTCKIFDKLNCHGHYYEHQCDLSFQQSEPETFRISLTSKASMMVISVNMDMNMSMDVKDNIVDININNVVNTTECLWLPQGHQGH